MSDTRPMPPAQEHVRLGEPPVQPNVCICAHSPVRTAQGIRLTRIPNPACRSDAH